MSDGRSIWHRDGEGSRDPNGAVAGHHLMVEGILSATQHLQRPETQNHMPALELVAFPDRQGQIRSPASWRCLVTLCIACSAERRVLRKRPGWRAKCRSGLRASKNLSPVVESYDSVDVGSSQFALTALSQRPNDASCTSQSQSCGNEIPHASSCARMLAVAMQPGWELVSRITIPSSPFS